MRRGDAVGPGAAHRRLLAMLVAALLGACTATHRAATPTAPSTAAIEPTSSSTGGVAITTTTESPAFPCDEPGRPPSYALARGRAQLGRIFATGSSIDFVFDKRIGIPRIADAHIASGPPREFVVTLRNTATTLPLARIVALDSSQIKTVRLVRRGLDLRATMLIPPSAHGWAMGIGGGDHVGFAFDCR